MSKLSALIVLLIVAVPVSSDIGLKDPTRPGDWQRAKAVKSAKPPELQSVIFGSERRVAVIDGTVFAEGSETNGIRLVAVRRNEVDVFVRGQGALVLTLVSPVFKESNDE